MSGVWVSSIQIPTALFTLYNKMVSSFQVMPLFSVLETLSSFLPEPAIR
jgi:hypothetical protein